MLDEIIGKSWANIIGDEFTKPYMANLSQWLQIVRESKTVYPDREDVFRALKLCPFSQVKVCIIGQDPYYNGQADGLCFSYKDGQRHNDGRVQSLDVILKEIENDVYNGFNVNYNYDLSYLAKEGVLLLNTVLTVFRNQANSHKEIGWQFLTSRVVWELIKNPDPIVFLLWGKEAKEFFAKCNRYASSEIEWEFMASRKLILTAPHPASDLYRTGSFGEIKPDYPNTFTGCKHFSQTNDFLARFAIEPINWFDVREPHFNENLKDKFIPF